MTRFNLFLASLMVIGAGEVASAQPEKKSAKPAATQEKSPKGKPAKAKQPEAVKETVKHDTEAAKQEAPAVLVQETTSDVKNFGVNFYLSSAEITVKNDYGDKDTKMKGVGTGVLGVYRIAAGSAVQIPLGLGLDYTSVEEKSDLFTFDITRFSLLLEPGVVFMPAKYFYLKAIAGYAHGVGGNMEVSSEEVKNDDGSKLSEKEDLKNSSYYYGGVGAGAAISNAWQAGVLVTPTKGEFQLKGVDEKAKFDGLSVRFEGSFFF